MHLKNGYSLKVGDIFDASQIDDIYDIKATVNGSMSPAQLTTLKNLSPNVKSVNTPVRYTAIGGWMDNPRYVNDLRILGLIGLIGTAHSIVHAAEYDSELDRIAAEAHRIRTMDDPLQRKADLVIWLQNDVKRYLSHFIPDENVVNLGVGAATLKVLSDLE